MSASTDQAFEVREKLATLEAQLLETTPQIKDLLREIHRHLKADPDVVTILSEEECAVLIRGLKKQTGIEISTKALNKTPKKALSKLTVSDL